MTTSFADPTCVLAEEGEHSPYILELKQRLTNLVKKEKDGQVEYVGGAKSLGLWNDGKVAVARSVMHKGDVLPSHIHETERMWIIVVGGIIDVTIDNEINRIEATQSVIIEPDAKHSVEAIEDATLIGITIPAEAAFPNVPGHS